MYFLPPQDNPVLKLLELDVVTQPVIIVLKRLRQEDPGDFGVNLGYTASSRAALAM